VSKPFRFERTGDRQVDQVQRNVAFKFSLLDATPFADGQWIRNVSFTANTAKRVSHSLGRSYIGWVALRPVAALNASLANTPVAFGELNPQPPGLSSKSIDIVASQTCTADLWVY